MKQLNKKHISVFARKHSVVFSLKRIISLLLATLLLVTVIPSVMAVGPSAVTVTISGSAIPLAGAKKVGVNIEMSMTSDEMWAADGNWMEETFNSGGINMMRWGYDAWAFDWEDEVPLSPNRYWGGLNTKDAAGTFGLREFIAYCKKYNVVPFVMIPIESLNTFGGEATLDKVKALTSSMAAYINEQGIETAYFDMGNEPWNNGAGDKAAQYGELFPSFQQIIKAANSNYKLVLQRSPQNFYWDTLKGNWNNKVIKASQNCFDAYDDHRYSFYDWNKYFDKNSDSLFAAGTVINDKEAILGECNIGWTNKADNWDEGHTRDMGGGMALLNAMLDQVNWGQYKYVVSWPSHYPSKAVISACPAHPFGWFNLDEWYLNQKTVRLTGPQLAHRIINENVLSSKLNCTSTGNKVRPFAYTDGNKLKVIVINKWDPTTLTIQIPAGYNSVSAMIMKSTAGITDMAPDYVSHINGNTAVTGTSFQNTIPGESVIVYTFVSDNAATAPTSFAAISPINNSPNVSTAKTFSWVPAVGAINYRLVVSQNADLSAPFIDVYTSGVTKYQSSKNLAASTTYYWNVIATNRSGETTATGCGSFHTAAS